MKKYFLGLFLILFFSSNSFAKEEFLPQIEEKRAQNLFLQVKCLACEGQVIESSDAQIAFEFRKLIRQKILEGKTDEEIKYYLVENYGAQILTSPPLNNETLLLWISPFIFLIFGLIFFIFILRKRKA